MPGITSSGLYLRVFRQRNIRWCCVLLRGLQVIDNYPSEWDFLKSHIADMKLLTTQQVSSSKQFQLTYFVTAGIQVTTCHFESS